MLPPPSKCSRYLPNTSMRRDLCAGRPELSHGRTTKNSPRVAVVNALFARKLFGSVTQRDRQIFQDRGWNARAGGGRCGRRKILSIDRRSAAGDVSSVPAIARQPHMPGGALGTRSAASWRLKSRSSAARPRPQLPPTILKRGRRDWTSLCFPRMWLRWRWACWV